MPENPKQSPFYQWWRWPLVPFAAVFGAGVGSVLLPMLHWIYLKFLRDLSEDGWTYVYVMPLVSATAFGWLYIWITCAVAPRRKFISGIVMTTILFIITFASAAIAWYLPKYSVGGAIQHTASCVAAVVAAVGALIHAHTEHGLAKAA